MFAVVEPGPAQGLSPQFDETLIELAAAGRPAACIWEAGQGLVVPRGYARHEGFAAACERFAQAGWPVSVRQSGGGIVPQGPGIVNFSLARGVSGKPLDHSTPAYALICRLIGQALEEFGIAAHAQAVEGSFCDGRYNLAVGSGPQARKIAGTAQLWRRRPLPGGGFQEVGLVHALILVHTDVAVAGAMANAFEEALGTSRRYLAERTVSAHTLCREGDGAALVRGLKAALARLAAGCRME
ncbi:MAG: lipoate--protein ligase family protein [Alcaligenaceae bacterium]|nr:lipoate--protein ligase family protein [Alcaligenaceae bacterium]